MRVLNAELSSLGEMETESLSYKKVTMQKGKNARKKCVGFCNLPSTLATDRYPSSRITVITLVLINNVTGEYLGHPKPIMKHWASAVRNSNAHGRNGLWPGAEQMGPSASTRNAWEGANLNECIKLDPHALSP